MTYPNFNFFITTITSETTAFKIQFPREFPQETSKAHFNESKNSFQDFDLNIGWLVAIENEYKPNKEDFLSL